MIYSNPEFFILFILTLIFFYLGKTQNFRLNLLIISSFIFYAWSGFFHTAIFAAVVIISWLAVYFSTRYPEKRSFFLSFGIVVMAFHLFFWKYASWACLNVQQVFPNFLGGKEVHLPLPIGISFFTLQGVAYLVDVDKGSAKIMGFRKYVLFKSFFAQLVAGPIVRAHQLLPQLEELVTPEAREVILGLSLFLMGFFKKIVIADAIGGLVDPVFLQPAHYGRESLILGVVGYGVQIWADFSGYTDMGRGAARILGIKLPENFLSPYLSRTPSEYWSRWHITLSKWIHDYIFLPSMLKWSEGKTFKVIMIVLATMFISGLWHGAAWTFALWGVYHGILLLIQYALKPTRLNILFHKLPQPVANVILIATMFCATLFGWLIFRAQSWTMLVLYLKSTFKPVGSEAVASSSSLYASLIFCILFQCLFYYHLHEQRFVILQPLGEKIDRLCASLRTNFSPGLGYRLADFGIGFGLAAFFTACLFFRYMGKSNPFIYFKF